MRRLSAAQLFVVGFLVLIFVGGAIAGQMNRRTKITFNGAVRVPGAVLQPGTYFFSAPSSGNRALVKVENEGGQFITQFMGIYDFTEKPDHEFIVFADHDCGPKAIKSWFYPTASPGVRFVYSDQEAALIAAACDDPVPETHGNSMDAARLQSSSVYVMTPQKQEQSYKANAFSTSDQRDKNGFDADR